MKLVAKIAAVLAVLAALALAAPALACADHADKTAETKAAPSKTVAKADRQKKQAQPKRDAAAKPAPAPTAAN